MIPLIRWPVWVTLIVLAFVGGVFTGYRYWKPSAPVAETAAQAERQSDGSLVLGRSPDANAKPKQTAPAGSTLARVISVTVRPRPVPASSVVLTPSRDSAAIPVANPLHTDSVQCPNVTVDLSLFRLPDRSYRVVASSPNGDVVGGIDVPVDPIARDRVRHWATGPSWNRMQLKPTGWFLDRDIGPGRVGVSIHGVRDSLLVVRDTLPVKKLRAPTRGVFEVRVGLPF